MNLTTVKVMLPILFFIAPAAYAKEWAWHSTSSLDASGR